MMLSKLVLCASVVLLGEVQADEPKSQLQAEIQVQQQGEQQEAPKEEGEQQESEQPSPPTPLPAGEGRGDDDVASLPVRDGREDEKEIDGVRLRLIEANIVSYTNTERARYGLPPLKVDENLMKTAREHAAWMTRNQSMTHTWRPVAENIAMGQPHSSDAVRAWMNSSGHRANILSSGHHRIGVAAFRTANGTIFWCQQFLR